MTYSILYFHHVAMAEGFEREAGVLGIPVRRRQYADPWGNQRSFMMWDVDQRFASLPELCRSRFIHMALSLPDRSRFHSRSFAFLFSQSIPAPARYPWPLAGGMIKGSDYDPHKRLLPHLGKGLSPSRCVVDTSQQVSHVISGVDPEGGCYFTEAWDEIITAELFNRASSPVFGAKQPLAIGMYQESSLDVPLGFSVWGVPSFGITREAKAGRLTGSEIYANWGKAIRAIHLRGGTHPFLHWGNISIGQDGEILIHDTGNSNHMSRRTMAEKLLHMWQCVDIEFILRSWATTKGFAKTGTIRFDKDWDIFWQQYRGVSPDISVEPEALLRLTPAERVLALSELLIPIVATYSAPPDVVPVHVPLIASAQLVQPDRMLIATRKYLAATPLTDPASSPPRLYRKLETILRKLDRAPEHAARLNALMILMRMRRTEDQTATVRKSIVRESPYYKLCSSTEKQIIDLFLFRDTEVEDLSHESRLFG